MSKSGSFVTKLIQPWMILFLLGHLIASIGQLYVFSKFEVGKTVALFGAVSIVTASVLGYLLLHETLSVTGYIGIMIAVTAFLVLVYR
jgi:drug/metabolite transporter (DMT)-like permease